MLQGIDVRSAGYLPFEGELGAAALTVSASQEQLFARMMTSSLQMLPPMAENSESEDE